MIRRHNHHLRHYYILFQNLQNYHIRHRLLLLLLCSRKLLKK
jgi:hypothetical protein